MADKATTYFTFLSIADGQNRIGRAVNRTVEVYSVGSLGALIIRLAIRNSGVGISLLKAKLEISICVGHQLALKNHKRIVTRGFVFLTIGPNDIIQALADTSAHADTKGGACSALGYTTHMAAIIFRCGFIRRQFGIKGGCDDIEQIPDHQTVGFLSKKRIRKSVLTANGPNLTVTEISNSRDGIIEAVLMLASCMNLESIALFVSQLDFIHGEVILLEQLTNHSDGGHCFGFRATICNGLIRHGSDLCLDRRKVGSHFVSLCCSLHFP